MSGQNRFGGGPPEGRPPGNGSSGQRDEEVARDILSILLDDDEMTPPELPDRTIRKVQNELTSRDLIDLTTFVFLMRFCAPLLDLIAAFFGELPEERDDRRNDHE